MADPIVSLEVIDGPVPVPAEGGVLRLKVSAHDPDVGTPGKVYTATGSATSSDGASMPFSIQVMQDGVPGDTITGYALACDDPAVVIEQDASDPSVFSATFPPNAP